MVCVLWCVVPAGKAAGDWAQWRGPSRDGVVDGPAWPAELSEQALTRVWRVDLAEGYPGPIISGGRVFTVETLDQREEVVRAFDAKTGEALWQQKWPGAIKVPFFARRNGNWIKSTPATDGEHLYVMGMLDELVCLRVEDGSMVWEVDFKDRYGTAGPMFGQPCSPLVDGEAVYVQAGLSVCKLNKKTGETIWRTMHDGRDFIGGNFSSPVIGEVAGVRQLLVQTRGELAGIDLETGKVLWREPIKAFRGMNIVPPTVIDGDHVFTSSYGGGSFMFKITRNAHGVWVSEKIWERPEIEGYMSSPILIDGHIYLHGRDKMLRCLGAKTGEVKWTSEEKLGDYWSFVVRGDRMLALGHDGTLRLIEASPDALRIKSSYTISDQETWGHLAMVGDMLYVRELKGLSVYRWTGQAALAD